MKSKIDTCRDETSQLNIRTTTFCHGTIKFSAPQSRLSVQNVLSGDEGIILKK